MIKILFVCHGNICRSTMAEFVLKDLAEKAGLTAADNLSYEDDAYVRRGGGIPKDALLRAEEAGCDLYIASAATSREEIGNGPHPGTRRLLSEHGIGCAGKRARQMTKQDYEDFDLIICMDRQNLRNMRRFTDDDPEGKVHLMMEYAGYGKRRKDGTVDTDTVPDVADPWWTGDYETTWQDIYPACEKLLEEIRA